MSLSQPFDGMATSAVQQMPNFAGTLKPGILEDGLFVRKECWLLT